MTPEEIIQFNDRGRQAVTRFIAAIHDLQIWTEAFEARGGQATFGDDAAQIVAVSNALQTFLTAPRRALLARLRSDI